MISRQHIKKQRHCFVNKGPSSQGYGFSSGHECIWELDYKEGWASKNWCFWTVVLKTLESPLDCKEIQPVHAKGDQSWVFFGKTDAKAETPILWPPDMKKWLTGKDPDTGRIEGRRRRGRQDEMARCHHQLDRQEFEWTPGVGDGQGAWCAAIHGSQSVGHDWVTELNWTGRGCELLTKYPLSPSVWN